MSSTCRALAVVAVVGGLGGLILHETVVHAQVAQIKVKARPAVPVVIPVPGGAPGAGPGGEGDTPKDMDALAITFPKDAKAKGALEAAADFIREANWPDATHVLQGLLNKKEDIFVEVERVNGKVRTTHYTSIRNEANRLLGTMPKEGLDTYEVLYGPKAKQQLEEAKKTGDPQMLAEVAQKYLHTKAGAQATELLGTYYLSRGQPVMAVNCFERLLLKEGYKPSPVFLLKAALSYQRCGDKDNTKRTWDRLARLSPAGVRFNDQSVGLDELQKELENVPSTGQLFGRHDWAMVRGSPSRNAIGYGDKPFLDEDSNKWVQHLIHQDQTKAWVDQAVKAQETQQQAPVIPGFFPIAARRLDPKTHKREPTVFYRSYFGVHAVDLKTGKLVWEQDLDYSADNLVNSTRGGSKLVQIQQWLGNYQTGGHLNLLYENSTLNTLSTDNNLVFAIDDLALPPHPLFLQNFMWGGQPNYGPLIHAMHCNRLLAISVDSGKRIWQAGGRLAQDVADNDKGMIATNPALADTYFLGVPLPLGGKVYVLAEKQSELKLVCLNGADGSLAWTQTLASVRDPLQRDVGRRMQSVNLAFGDGVLVCPTNAGAILGLDLMTHSLIWAHPYHKVQPTQQPRRQPGVWPNQFQVTNMTPDFKCSAPIIQDGRVVFTAPDGETIRCLNVRDGSLMWEAARAGDIYLGGVYNGKVVLVGKNNCRALSLASGKQIWNLDTGIPSGHGVASDKTYYLPLKSSVNDKEGNPEVCAIDIDTGVIAAHTKSHRKDTPGPGNLIFYEGKVISQTVREIVAYPQLKVKLAEMNIEIAKDPKSPKGLIERAELRRSDGELGGAVEDLRVALANNPPDDLKVKARKILFESLTDLFGRNFADNEKYLDEYREMCTVKVADGASVEERKKAEEEQKRRRANYLCLVAKGREKQGNLLDAFKHYEEFGKMGESAGLLTVADEPTVKARPDIWAQGRIAAMILKATPDKRKPLEDAIAARWQEIRNAGDVDIDRVRQFVGVFGSLFTVGKEARLFLAEKLIDRDAFLEAELHLLQVRRQDDKQLAARSVEMLARLMSRKGLMEDAAYWYRILGSEFSAVAVREGKTGAEFLNDLATDKRFLPFLDEPQHWAGAVKYKEEFGQFHQMQTTYFFEPEGEVLPFFDRNRLAFNLNSNSVKLVDRLTGEERWNQVLPRQNNNHLQYLNWNQYNPQSQVARFPYFVQGHTAVFSLGLKVYAFDLADKRILWEKNLFGDEPLPITQIIPNPQGGGLNAMFPDNRTERIGQAGPFEPGYVCLQTREGLTALDPIKGTVLWSKSDVPAATQVFGDDQNVYMIEVRNDGSVGSGKAVRAHDGVTVNLPDFAGIYGNRLGNRGRNMLVKETDAKNNLTLRMYDVLTGKDVWKKEFTGNPILMQSEEPNMVGVVEPGNAGKVTVLDTVTQKVLLSTNIDPKLVDKARGVTLLEDRDYFYVAINGPQNAQANPWGGPWPALHNGTRGIPVSGRFYAIHRNADKEGKHKKWWVDLEDQVLVLDQYKDLPILLFTSRSQKLMNGGVFQCTSTTTVEKRTAKVIYDKKLQNNNIQFHTLNINQRAGTIDLIGYNVKIQHYMER
jgi:outer membrane protein assembly factor BamB